VLLIAGALLLLLAAGHTFVGHRWVLPRLRRDSLPETPLGGSSMTANFLNVTWDVVGIALVGLSALVLVLSGRSPSPDRTLALNVVAAIMTVATVLVLWLSRRRPANLLRAPIWMLFVVIAVICWVQG
jgi:hypothetical protein